MAPPRLDRGYARRLSRFLRRAEPAADVIGLAAMLCFFLSILPIDVLSPYPATGGDTGSHFWPLYTLTHFGLPEGTLRPWNPGNLLGEPHLVHYFPFPYLVMASLSAVVPLGTAFNLGTALGLFAFPLCCYVCLRAMSLRFPAPLLGAAVGLWLLYNEGYSMWGGNFLSTLAGQFAHQYAIDCLLLGTGALVWELRKGRKPILSALLFAATACSHAYVFVGAPGVFLAVMLWPSAPFSKRFSHLVIAGLGALCLSAFFWIPMLDNSSWTSAAPMVWIFRDVLSEILPRIFYPLALAPLMLAVTIFVKGRAIWRTFMRQALFWGVPSLFFLFLYFAVFRPLKLVDVRAVPQIQLFICLWAGATLGIAFRRLSRVTAWLLSVPLVLCSIWWSDLNIANAPGWAMWNYSGWITKPLYPELERLSAAVRGNFSEPRIMPEHAPSNNAAGTTRVFEMLPYFAGRATLESVYLEATILSPPVLFLQALISKSPSCPIPNMECPTTDLSRAVPKLDLLGVGALILASPEAVKQAALNPAYIEKGSFGPWHVMMLAEQPALAGVLTEKPEISADRDWRGLFLDWFKRYDGTGGFLAARSTLPDASQPAITWTDNRTCSPRVHVEFNRLTLQTNCPGRAHYLKFAYHPAFRASSGDPIFMVSPGFLALVPSEGLVVLEFGKRPLWYASGVISFATVVLLLCLAAWSARKKER